MEKAANSKYEVPIWEKYLLSIEEGAVYFHIGEGKFCEMIAYNPTAPFFLKNGRKTLIKRKKFEEFLDYVESV